MKKIVFILILVILSLYVLTGRHHVVRDNIAERGYPALLDEPTWVYEYLSNTVDAGVQFVRDLIDGKTLGRPLMQ